MTPPDERAALVALLRTATRPWHEYADLVEDQGSAIAVLEQERGLFSGDELAAARAAIASWERRRMRLTTVLDDEYPENLRGVYDRPPILFVAGGVEPEDGRSVAVIGSRQASTDGLARARATALELVGAGYVVVSGLAAGVDTAAHTAALDCDGRTIAVIGTGLDRCYPAENRGLQRRIAADGAVVSQFWPEAPASRHGFPMRNAVMSGLALATVVIEASQHSGARTQVRAALGHGRPVLLHESLLAQGWARDCAGRGGVHVVGSAGEIVEVIERLESPEPLAA
jgi:DNA processing protein